MNYYLIIVIQIFSYHEALSLTIGNSRLICSHQQDVAAGDPGASLLCSLTVGVPLACNLWIQSREFRFFICVQNQLNHLIEPIKKQRTCTVQYGTSSLLGFN